MKSLLQVLTVLTVAITSASAIPRIFDRGDCKMDPRLLPILVGCFGRYENLIGITDEKYQAASLIEQGNIRKNFMEAGMCALRFAQVMDDDGLIDYEKLFNYYERYLILEPPCRKQIIQDKVRKCFANYKSPKQNVPACFCFYFAQMEVCAVDFKDASCPT